MDIYSVFDYYKITKYSPSGGLFILCLKNKLKVINSADGSQLREVESFNDIKDINWCRDEVHVLYLTHDKNTVSAFSLENKKWTCTIDTGIEEAHCAIWSPTGRHIITFSKLSLRATVWSLEGLRIIYIDNGNIIGNYTFSSSGLYYAIPTCGTSTRIYETDYWTCTGEIVHVSQVNNTPIWSPIYDHFALFNNLDFRYCYVAVFAAEDGKTLGKFEREGEKGITGVRSVQWSPSGQLLAIACFDDCIYIIEHLLWSIIVRFDLKRQLTEPNVKVYKFINHQYTELTNRPINFTASNKLTKENVLPGIRQMFFSRESNMLASVFECTPALVWIWNVTELDLITVIVFDSAVTDLKWGARSTLSICDNSTSLTMFQNGIPGRIVIEETEGAEMVHSIEWDNLGTNLTLKGKFKAYFCRIQGH